MKGQPVENAPESLRLFGICANMEWNHLPVPGGIYAQHPRLMSEWLIIFDIKNRYEKQQIEKNQPKGPRR